MSDQAQNPVTPVVVPDVEVTVEQVQAPAVETPQVQAPAEETPQVQAPAVENPQVQPPATVAETEDHPTNPNLIRNIVLGIIGLLVVLALIFGIIWLGKQAFAAPASTDSNERIVATEAPVVDSEPETEQEAPVTGTGISEQTVLDLGSIGAFHAVYDYKLGQWTLGIWEESTVRAGTGLSEFKLKATSVSFVMPANGVINNSAGHISVNSQEWVLGNPAQSPSGDPLVKKGDTITIWTDGPNESAGFQIWFK